jgi:RNA ligase (TIGR02306 family)
MDMTTENLQTRALATIRTIAAIKPHTNADALELAIVDGWQCVVKKGEYKAGDLAIYAEIDSWLPHEIAPFLSKGKEPREFEGVKGEKLRTIRLRGELSQGLLLPLSVAMDALKNPRGSGWFQVGDDVTGFLGIKKWEKPLNPQLQGLARGNFPSFIRKTDQERIQNLFKKLTPEQIADTYEVTLKIDGSSTTFFVNEGEVGVCSRNLELKLDDENTGNSFVKMFNDLGMREKLLHLHNATGQNIAVQGELWGSGINGNWEGVSDIRFSAFDLFSIDDGRYMMAFARTALMDMWGVHHAPVIGVMTLESFKTIEDFLAFADRASIYNKVAEGVVFKSLTKPDFSFKVINNKYLLSGGE